MSNVLLPVPSSIATNASVLNAQAAQRADSARQQANSPSGSVSAAFEVGQQNDRPVDAALQQQLNTARARLASAQPRTGVASAPGNQTRGQQRTAQAQAALQQQEETQQVARQQAQAQQNTQQEAQAQQVEEQQQRINQQAHNSRAPNPPPPNALEQYQISQTLLQPAQTNTHPVNTSA